MKNPRQGSLYQFSRNFYSISNILFIERKRRLEMLKKVCFIMLVFMFMGSVCFAQGASSNATNDSAPAVHKEKTSETKGVKVQKKKKKKHSVATKKELENKTQK
jgi:hypothetical protein